MLDDLDGFGDQFDLLHDAWRFVTEVQTTAAIGTARQRVLDAVIDLASFKRRSLMALMPPLAASFTFFVRLKARRLDDVAGRRLGRRGGILLGSGKFTLHGGKLSPSWAISAKVAPPTGLE